MNAGLSAVLPLGDIQYECGGAIAYTQSYDPTWGRVKAITRPVAGDNEHATTGDTNCDATGEAGGHYGYFGAVAGDPAKGYYSFELGSWHIVGPQLELRSADVPQARRRRGGSGPTSRRTRPPAPWRTYTCRGSRPRRSLHSFGKTVLANSQARGKAFGVLKLTLRPAGYDWRFVPAVGATFTDSGSATCHGGDGSGDTQPPSLPSGLSASAPTSRRVELSWTAATDDVGVTGHEVYRDGVLTATAGPGVTFSDDTVVPASSYEYYVRARDAAGDVSAPSEPASVTTPPATGEATFVCWTRRERDDQLLVGDRSHVGHQAAARDGVYG